MISKVIFSNRTLQNFINNGPYDALLIQEIIWRSNSDGVCEPFIVGKLIKTIPKAEVKVFPVDLLILKNANHLKLTACN